MKSDYSDLEKKRQWFIIFALLIFIISLAILSGSVEKKNKGTEVVKVK